MYQNMLDFQRSEGVPYCDSFRVENLFEAIKDKQVINMGIQWMCGACNIPEFCLKHIYLLLRYDQIY